MFVSMVNCYHGGEKLAVQLACASSSKLPNLLERRTLTNNTTMDDISGEMSWDMSNSCGTCSTGKDEKLWNESDSNRFIPLDPPLEFQDKPNDCESAVTIIHKFASELSSKLITDALLISSKVTWSIPCSQVCHMSDSLPLQNQATHWSGLRLCWTPELLGGNIGTAHPSSRSSLSSRLSSSHNSLLTSRIDESSFITSAVSHDVLSSSQSSDMYNVPLDSDNYAIPVDVVKSDNPKPPVRTKKRQVRSRRFHSTDLSGNTHKVPVISSKSRNVSSQMNISLSRGVTHNTCRTNIFRESRPACSDSEPIHLTLQEVRQYMHNLYSSSSDSSENRMNQETFKNLRNPFRSVHNNNNINAVNNNNNLRKSQNASNYNNNIFINNNNNNNNYYNKNKKNAFSVMVKGKKAKENCESSDGSLNKIENLKKSSGSRPSFSLSIKQALCNLFRFKRLPTPEQCLGKRGSVSRSDDIGVRLSGYDDKRSPCPITKPPFSKRALPPLPGFDENRRDVIVTDSTPLPSAEDVPPPPLPLRVKRCNDKQFAIDFASSIEKVKDYGWYWGPISGEAAEKILSNEPDGSFVVRDSSDDYYIFSLTFKLNSVIRHVRIEHDQGKFSFGSSHRFKSNTIVDFIESAVEHSRSGRYLFFLHRRPVLGPMRVQLLHPVSRFKQVQSLQHMCRFVILKFVRKDLIKNLPLPVRVLDYLSKQHYYSEEFLDEDECDSSFQELNHFLRFQSEEEFS